MSSSSWYAHAWRRFRGWPLWVQVAVVLVVIAVIAGAAGSPGSKKLSAAAKSTPTTTSSDPSVRGRVTKSDFGNAWPLTVTAGTLGCQNPPSPGAVTFTTDDGTVYWLNGTAGDIAAKQGWRDVRPIRAKARHGLFARRRKDIGVLIDAGLRLCPRG